MSKIEWALACVVALCGATKSHAQAGYFEISANGSYFRHNNGIQDGEPATSTVTRMGGGLAYRFMTNTSLELSYVRSETRDSFGQDISSASEVYFIERKSKFDNLALNVILHFADRKSTFRPYVLAGGGYMIRKSELSGKGVDRITNAERPLVFAEQDKVKSISADAGIGLSIYVLDQIALELSYTVYATDLDKPDIMLHYSMAGGMKVLF